PGPPAVFGTLAVPQLLDDERVRQQQEDLGYVLVLAILVGLVAAVGLAGLAAGTLARPVAALRDAAVAVGRGAPVPAFPPGAPLEVTPVLSAFGRMAADVRRSQGAVEGARRGAAAGRARGGPGCDACVVSRAHAPPRARAPRVMAWGELARQVAHEIKNPLTPIRLGIQHLQRAHRGTDFDRTLQDTAARILAEIDRLDAIARAFSRFGAPGAEQAPLEPVDLHAVAREVVDLYALGGRAGPTTFTLAGVAGPAVRARRGEVKEVLVNLLENARQAGARAVEVSVDESGRRGCVRD